MNETLYDGSKDGDDKEMQGSNIPFFQNQNISTAAWIDVDKNGDFYISISPPLLRTFNLFVKDRFQSVFNEMIEHLIEQGKLSKSAMQGDSSE